MMPFSQKVVVGYAEILYGFCLFIALKIQDMLFFSSSYGEGSNGEAERNLSFGDLRIT